MPAPVADERLFEPEVDEETVAMVVVWGFFVQPLFRSRGHAAAARSNAFN